MKLPHAIVIGGGPTGFELAGTLVAIARHRLPDEFRHTDSTCTKVVLAEGSDRLLGACAQAADRDGHATASLTVSRLGGAVLADIPGGHSPDSANCVV